MILRLRTFKLILAISCILSLLAAGAVLASPSSVVGKAGDPRGDAPREGDLVHVTAEYDPQGQVQIKLALVDFAETARGDTIIGGIFSKWRSGECQNEKFGTGLAFEPGTGEVKHILHASGHTDIGPAQASVRGNVVTVTASAGNLAGRGYDCVDFLTLTPTGPEETAVLDGRTVRLRGR